MTLVISANGMKWTLEEIMRLVVPSVCLCTWLLGRNDGTFCENFYIGGDMHSHECLLVYFIFNFSSEFHSSILMLTLFVVMDITWERCRLHDCWMSTATSQHPGRGHSSDWCSIFGLVAWRSGNTLCPINEVAVHWTGLIPGWVTVCGQANHLGM